MSRLRLTLLLALCAFAPTPSGPGPARGIATHLPVPRFVSLRSDEVNFRAGPGFQYPVVWVYRRDGLPVEITGEFDVWRQVTAPDGGTGWVHQATIRPRRSFFVTADTATLRSRPTDTANPVAYLKQSVTGELISCTDQAFCEVAVNHVTGYLARDDFWGTFTGETVKK
jgi:SH3-like domain-containing protein